MRQPPPVNRCRIAAAAQPAHHRTVSRLPFLWHREEGPGASGSSWPPSPELAPGGTRVLPVLRLPGQTSPRPPAADDPLRPEPVRSGLLEGVQTGGAAVSDDAQVFFRQRAAAAQTLSQGGDVMAVYTTRLWLFWPLHHQVIC